MKFRNFLKDQKNAIYPTIENEYPSNICNHEFELQKITYKNTIRRK